MSETERVGHELIEPCLRCDGTASGIVAESIDDGRVVWTVSSRCTGCGRTTQTRERAVTANNIVRQAVVARVGLARLRADPDINQPMRLPLLAVFRKNGATIGVAADAYARLTGAGLTGTPAEMQLLARHLVAEGALVTVEPHDRDT